MRNFASSPAIEAVLKHLRPRVNGWQVLHSVLIDGDIDGWRVRLDAYRTDKHGALLRGGGVLNERHGQFRIDAHEAMQSPGSMVEILATRTRMLMSQLFPTFPPFRIRTKHSPKRFVPKAQ